jgi:hypothetical protein
VIGRSRSITISLIPSCEVMKSSHFVSLSRIKCGNSLGQRRLPLEGLLRLATGARITVERDQRAGRSTGLAAAMSGAQYGRVNAGPVTQR